MPAGDTSSWPIELTRGAVKLIARQVFKHAKEGGVGPAEVDSLKRMLQELRNAEDDFLALQLRKRETIPMVEASIAVKSVVGRLVRVLDLVCTTVGNQAIAWRSDPAWLALPSDEAARVVREWVAKVCRDVRTAEAHGAAKLLAEAAVEAE
jgi:hypothetical protein